MSDLRSDGWRVLERQFAASGAMSQAQIIATANTSLVMLYGADLPSAMAAFAFFARLMYFLERHRAQCRALALYYSASTPEEIGELLRMRGMHGFADHVELLCRAAGPMHTILRQHADNIASGRMLGGAWLRGNWTDAEAIRALRWAAERIEAHPVKPVGWDDSALPREARRPNRWQGKRRTRR